MKVYLAVISEGPLRRAHGRYRSTTQRVKGCAVREDGVVLAEATSGDRTWLVYDLREKLGTPGVYEIVDYTRLPERDKLPDNIKVIIKEMK